MASPVRVLDSPLMPAKPRKPRKAPRKLARRWSSIAIVMITPHASRTVWVMFGSKQQAGWIAEAINEVLVSNVYEPDDEANVCMESWIADLIKVWCEAPALKQIPLPEYLKASLEALKPVHTTKFEKPIHPAPHAEE